MNQRSLLVLCLALPLLIRPPLARAQESGDHLFILSGQSNMAGMDPQAGFVPECERLFGADGYAYVKLARGGQPIRYWVRQWDEIAARHGVDEAKRNKDKDQVAKFYEPMLEQYRKVLAEHPDPASVTFCWMQGERDAREQLSDCYSDALKQLIANLREDLERPDMKFVIGRLSDFGKPDNAHWQAVRQAQVAVAESDPHGAWVDCDDLNNKLKDGQTRDDLHYTKEGYALLGRRFARQADALIEGREPAKDGRPEPSDGGNN